jgi:class 3 adenylate cyclase
MALVCGQCGSPVGETSKFCPECGTKLPGESADDVRKTVTALFCDLVGSTSLGERTDPESLRALLERYFTVMRSALERHGGTVEKFIGDAVVAFFGVPVTREDDALRYRVGGAHRGQHR